MWWEAAGGSRWDDLERSITSGSKYTAVTKRHMSLPRPGPASRKEKRIGNGNGNTNAGRQCGAFKADGGLFYSVVLCNN